MNRFWEILYDDAKKTFDLKELTDDTLFTSNVVMLQNEGFNVHCQTGDIDKISGTETKLIGYKREKGLYQRLLLEYEQKTGKTAKRW